MAHFCVQHGCSVVLPRGQSRCDAHQRPAWGSVQAPQRIRGRRLQRMRQQLFTKQPLCVHCLAEGRTTVATIRDHIINLAAGGKDDNTNEQALCQECSDRKTQAEQQRGKDRTHDE